jgi:hypothetical protein
MQERELERAVLDLRAAHGAAFGEPLRQRRAAKLAEAEARGWEVEP